MESHKVSRRSRQVQKIMLLLLGLSLLRGMIYGLVIPVNQTPDEIYHFSLIKAKQLTLNHTYQAQQKLVAAQIDLTAYNLLYPESIGRRTLDDFKGGELPAPPASLQLYYTVTAGMLKILALASIRDEIYLIRAISVILGMLVVWLAFLSAQELFPENRFILVGVPTLITFIPQFSAMNGSINNDKPAEVFVSLALFLMLRSFKRGLTLPAVLLLSSVLSLALLSKRTAFFMLLVFVVFLLVSWWRWSLGMPLHLTLLGISTGVLIVGFLLLKYVPPLDEWVTDHIIWMPWYQIKNLFTRGELYSTQALKYYAKFFIVLYWSFWGVFGYMTIRLYYGWYLLVALAQCCALGGIIRFTRQVRQKRQALERWLTKSLYLFAVSIVCAVMVPFLRSSVLSPAQLTLTQGRYIFPVIIPISLLTVWGLGVLIPVRYYRLAGVLGVLALLVLDSVCLSNYLLLNFYLISIF